MKLVYYNYRGQLEAYEDATGIYGFFGKYRYLSNFHLSPVEYRGRIYPAVENAYMSAKTDSVEFKELMTTVEPKEAKKLGQTCALRPDWEDIKFSVMLALQRIKFKDPVLAKLLLATGDKYLEETNSWNDTYWGVCNGRGQNFLGKALMQVRKELQDEN